MRYHPDDKQKTHQRILKVAARRFRAEGLSGVGIANLMADLGLSHGGFYAHFTDKEALVTAACQEAFQAQTRQWDKLVTQHPAEPALNPVVSDYLSPHHRDHPDNGCFAAALASEMARRDYRSRQAFTSGIKNLLDTLGQLAGPEPQRHKPEAMLGLMVGSMMLARAVSDPELSDRLLRTALEAILKG
jgi:TetR/AcrR family transcriptional repressor of nem operon